MTESVLKVALLTYPERTRSLQPDRRAASMA